MDRGAWQAIVHVVTKSDMTKRLTHTQTHTHTHSTFWILYKTTNVSMRAQHLLIVNKYNHNTYLISIKIYWFME